MANKIQIYDAHHHLWDLDRCAYPWLEAKGVKRFFGDPTPIQQDYLAAELLQDAARFELAGTTHVQVGTAEEDSLAETAFVQEVNGACSDVGNAIVAFADLTRSDFEAELDCHANYANFRGIRQIIGRHPSEDSATNTGVLLANPGFAGGLETLAQREFSFDLQLIESNYTEASKLFAKIEGLQFAICHFASPWDLSSEGFTRWHAAMARFGSVPGAHMKFSGFGMFKSDWTATDIRPFVESAIEIFGEERCMAGSNFPVDKLYGGYDRIWLALEDILGPGDLLTKVTRTNAQRFYRVESPAI